jgi:cell wall-associated NlpC family hydrolase
VSNHNTGRHRAPSPVGSESSLSSAISRSAKPASKASAVIVISGAMVASLALPASADTPTVRTTTTAPAALAVPVANPSAAQAPMVPRTFGMISFRGVAKPKPVPVRITTDRASRSATRVALPQTAPGVLGIAASLAGIYYIYGGTTTAGFDCSGYTQYVFGKLGVSLPRTAEAQRQAATPVSNPQPGDLIFFGSPAHHVGIYAGNGKMWDSPETGSSVGLHSARTGGTYGRV